MLYVLKWWIKIHITIFRLILIDEFIELTTHCFSFLCILYTYELSISLFIQTFSFQVDCGVSTWGNCLWNIICNFNYGLTLTIKNKWNFDVHVIISLVFSAPLVIMWFRKYVRQLVYCIWDNHGGGWILLFAGVCGLVGHMVEFYINCRYICFETFTRVSFPK